MCNNVLYSIEVFILILCILNVLKNIYNIIKVMKIKDGKFSSSKSDTLFLGLSISYIITVLIVGF